MRCPRLAILSVLLLASCAAPTPDQYVAATGRGAKVAELPLGRNATGEACVQQNQSPGSAVVYCGNWEQPSARILGGGAAGAGGLAADAVSSPWRRALDQRLQCREPASYTVLGQPAVIMQCSRRIGGWPELALVTAIDGRAWYADGVPPALPAMERSIGVLSGRLQPEQAGTLSAEQEALATRRFATNAFSANDLQQYDELMRRASRANLTQNYAVAELAYRAAAELQQKVLGRDTPAQATAVMSEALQLSNQGRFSEADKVFARAAVLVRSPDLPNKVDIPRLEHYRALHELNEGKAEEAVRSLQRAEAGYIALLPPDALLPAPQQSAGAFGSSTALIDQIDNLALLDDRVSQGALLGVIEARRNQAVALRLLGRMPESTAAADSATALARARGLADPAMSARLYRTTAMSAAEQGRTSAALSELSRSSADFARGLPGSRPIADTDLLRAAELSREGDVDETVRVCQEAARVLRDLKTVTTGTLVQPCLDAYAAAAGRGGSGSQAVLAEMFEVAQLAQGSLTSQQIAQASALLSENARDPRVAEAIRRREAASGRLADLFREKDELSGGGRAASAEAVRDLDRRLAEAQTEREEADSALQAASPNYGQLVQQVVKASEVFALLRPGEAFASFAPGEKSGWSFLLRDGRISVAPIPGGMQRAEGLVRRIRASMDLAADGTPKNPFDAAASTELYAALLGGVAAQLEGTEALVVAPSGPLLSIPFGLLLTGPADAHALGSAPWLIRRMTIAHVPAPANFVSLRKVAGGSRAGRPWFGFGDFVPIPLRQAEGSFPTAACAESARDLAGLAPLPRTRAELDAARAVFGGGANDELIGAAFTVEAVKRVPLAEYRMLHFATHAILPSDLRCQNMPAIITSSPPAAPTAAGALLTSAIVQTLKLDADAVILSACNTGGPNGSGAAGESLTGLARSFFYAGARALLVTHWEVNDQFNAYLVAVTLDSYKKGGGNLSGALATAERQILDDATGPRAWQAHPFYWAPLALIGEGGGPLPPAQRAEAGRARRL